MLRPRPEVRFVNHATVIVRLLLVYSGMLGVLAESDSILFEDSAKYEKSNCNLANGTCPKALWRKQRNCSAPTLADHILGGTEVQYNDFSHMAALGYPSEFEKRPIEFRCGASLITDQFLLTAAHCNGSGGPVVARLGVIDLFKVVPNDPPVDIAIARVFIHPKFRNRPRVADIALLKLDRAVYEEFLQPICVYTEPTDPAPGVQLTIVGWGNTRGEDEPSDRLLKATVTTWDRGECRERLRRNWMWPVNRFVLHDGQLCATRLTAEGEPLADACRGDSGGPLELVQDGQRYLVGVVSAGWECGTWHMPGIYTRVAHYVGWIDQVISQFGAE